MPFPCTVHVSRETWSREVNPFRVSVTFISWINRQAQILTLNPLLLNEDMSIQRGECMGIFQFQSAHDIFSPSEFMSASTRPVSLSSTEKCLKMTGPIHIAAIDAAQLYTFHHDELHAPHPQSCQAVRLANSARESPRPCAKHRKRPRPSLSCSILSDSD